MHINGFAIDISFLIQITFLALRLRQMQSQKCGIHYYRAPIDIVEHCDVRIHIAFFLLKSYKFNRFTIFHGEMFVDSISFLFGIMCNDSHSYEISFIHSCHRHARNDLTGPVKKCMQQCSMNSLGLV